MKTKSHKKNWLIFTTALSAYCIHTSRYIYNGHIENLLWACHLGLILIGIGFLFCSSIPIGIGFFWGTMGAALWSLDLLSGGEFVWTSLLSHVGGPCLGAYGIWYFGMKKGTWFWAVLSFFVLQCISRLITPAPENVNVSHFVWAGWEKNFPSYFWYTVMLYVIAATLYFSLEWIILHFGIKKIIME